MIDEQYVEYYEYLCQGIQKLLESGITLNADCESRGSTTSFQQPTVWYAILLVGDQVLANQLVFFKPCTQVEVLPSVQFGTGNL